MKVDLSGGQDAIRTAGPLEKKEKEEEQKKSKKKKKKKKNSLVVKSCSLASSGVTVICQAVMRHQDVQIRQRFLKFRCRHVDGYMRRMGHASQPTLPNFG